MKAAFDIADLRRRGFVGFVPVAQLDDKPLRVPYPSGVYAVVREATAAPRFLERSDAGWWKGKDPTVPAERLAAEWVTGVQTLYLGDAASLRERVGELAKFSRARGEPVRHSGAGACSGSWRAPKRCSSLGRSSRTAGPWNSTCSRSSSRRTWRLPFANLKRGNRNAPRPRGGMRGV